MRVLTRDPREPMSGCDAQRHEKQKLKPANGHGNAERRIDLETAERHLLYDASH